ncbi:hypothetical protein AJ80_06462 [Polytolypa hystricis UAMH7299]|uniref:Trafficking protein particle complex subunit 2/Sedlin n=1 Tax=Polytolypa hystricis (strain UAMH7299) TaxID=1447883 RepID=A0A2B7XVQ2_POLH7|nr:hypothetical protein AJ80_06462 [Polytolypa hystricis UAMH7299]
MSYYFTILSPTDVPLFSVAFGTSKAGGYGVARFRYPDTARYMNQFIVHASLDIVEELQWTNGAMYLKHIDTYPPNSAYISAFLTGSGARFLLLHQPPQPASSTTAAAAGTTSTTSASTTTTSGATAPGGAPSLAASMSITSSSSTSSSRASSSSIANNPTSPQTEEAIRQFMNEVYENWAKTVMSPFYRRGMEITSPVFKGSCTAS